MVKISLDPARSNRSKVGEKFRSKRLTIVHGFRPESENFNFGQKGYHMKGHLKRNRMVQISAS